MARFVDRERVYIAVAIHIANSAALLAWAASPHLPRAGARGCPLPGAGEGVGCWPVLGVVAA